MPRAPNGKAAARATRNLRARRGPFPFVALRRPRTASAKRLISGEKRTSSQMTENDVHDPLPLRTPICRQCSTTWLLVSAMRRPFALRRCRISFLQEIDTFLNCIGKAPFGSGKQLDCSIALAVETTARVSTLCPGLLFGDEVRLIRSEQLSFPCSEDDSELEIQRRQFSVSTNEASGRGLYFRTIETRFLGAPRHQQRFVLWKRRRDEVNKEQHKENQSEE